MELTCRTILVTGAAGFIGFHVCRRLLESFPEIQVVGVDCLSDYYDVRLKQARLRELEVFGKTWHFECLDICNGASLSKLFERFHPSLVVHLAAQAGVRHSVDHALSCVSANILGFATVLEVCHLHQVEHVVYASSSSVYGEREGGAFKESDCTDRPLSLYAASKKSDEVMAYAYSSLWGLPCTGVRIFSAYGPWGRPDMAYFSFSERWSRGEKIQLYNHGLCRRDFTYVDDVSAGIVRLLFLRPSGGVPHDIYNLGGGHGIMMTEFVVILHKCLIASGVLPANHDLASHVELVGNQPGDSSLTDADVSRLERAIGFLPQVTLQEGVMKFAEWYGSLESRQIGRA